MLQGTIIENSLTDPAVLKELSMESLLVFQINSLIL